jgi:hypothetical protein
MARKTLAQMAAEAEVEHQAQLAVARATYTERMMAVLERATKMNFELEVKAAKFVVSDRDERRVSPYVVQPAWTETADMDLYSLEVSVEMKEEARVERERVLNLRQTALAKLTDEERKALSL